MKTARLRLRQWLPSDREPFAALNGDPSVMEFLGEPLSRAASDALADRCEAGIAERGWGVWAVERQEDGRFLGFTGLNPVTPDFPFAPAVEVAWRLARDVWGHGYATEAAQCALGIGFAELQWPEIVSFTTVNNLRSAAVMQRLGMQFTGCFGHPRLRFGHPLREHVLYRLRPENASEKYAPNAL